jgi:hypothetical protein
MKRMIMHEPTPEVMMKCIVRLRRKPMKINKKRRKNAAKVVMNRNVLTCADERSVCASSTLANRELVVVERSGGDPVVWPPRE